MKRLILIICTLSFFQGFTQNNDPVLLKIDEKEITRSEFETIFKKNNRDSVFTKEDLDEYAQLFINFKLKVAEAEEMGMDTLPQFTRELQGYRDQLAAPYLIDKATTDSLLMEAYNRSLIEVKASHILIRMLPDPSPEDTLSAWRKIMEIKKEVERKPESFADVAAQRSEDPSAKTNGGDLGYFSALQMVYPFESAVYRAEVGEIAGPVRTKFGYHIIKVDDKRPARGEVRVAHIMIRSEESDPEEVKEGHRKRADEVYQKLAEGESFEELAKKYSDDRSSASKGGELPPFKSGKMVAEFEEAAFAIETPGEIVGPVKSPYGWHIIKLIQKIPVKSFDEMERELRMKVEKDSRSNLSKDSFIAKRKEEYNFTEDKRQLKPFYSGLDSTYFQGTWKPSTKLSEADNVLFTLDNVEYTQKDFLDFLLSKKRPNRKVVPVQGFVDENYKFFVDKTVMDYENSQLESKYPEYRALMNEYRDGILLFDLTDQKVWSKAVKDTVGLKAYYEENKEDFMWGERAEYDIYIVADEDLGNSVVKLLKKGKSKEFVREKLSQDSALSMKIESGLKEKEEVDVFSQISWAEGVSDVIDDEGQMKVVHIKEIRSPEPKGFDEARGLITAAYQSQLEDEWVKELRSTHKVELNEEVLYTIE
jgi:peptidyl-prolyl cis-trans isomerase SurA